MVERFERETEVPRDDDGGGRGGDDRAWTFRGYRLDPGHFTTAMVHFYRAEVTRSNTWRSRLDATTNWAVVTVAAALTFTFGAAHNPHFVLLLVFLLLLTFLYIEARRYRYYVLWAYRVHLMETDFFAAMLAPPFRPSSDWADHLVESLHDPTFPIASWESVGRRFRRNYIWFTTLLLISWGAKLAIHPTQATTWAIMVERAAIGTIPGTWVVRAVSIVYGGMLALALTSAIPTQWRRLLPSRLFQWTRRLRRTTGPIMPAPRTQERLATIITSRGQQVALDLLTELGRGVTALKGTGMYTSEARDVLLCAVTEVQVPHLQQIVHQADPSAFVIVGAAEDIRGWGFRSFEPPS